jgi:hypothetical protein
LIPARSKMRQLLVTISPGSRGFRGQSIRFPRSLPTRNWTRLTRCRDLCQKHKPVGEGVSGFRLYTATAVRRVVDDGRREIDDTVAVREKPCEGTTSFADLKGSATAEVLVKEPLIGQRVSAKCHVSSGAQATERSYLELVCILIAKGARALIKVIDIKQVRRNKAADGSGGLLAGE